MRSGGSSDSEESANEDEGESIPTCSPVLCMGRQLDSDTYVLGPSVQFTSDGVTIRTEEQKCIWVPWILKKMKVLNSIHPVSCLPVVQDPMGNLLSGLSRLTGANWPSGMLMLGEFS